MFRGCFSLGTSFCVQSCMCVEEGKCKVVQGIGHSITITSEVTAHTHTCHSKHTHTHTHKCFLICVSSGLKQHSQPLDKHNSLL